MTKKYLRIAMTVLSCINIYGYANAKDDKAYLSASYGIDIANKINYSEELEAKRLKNAQTFGLALGYRFNDNLRTEFAYNHFHNLKYRNYNQYDDVSAVVDYYYKQKIYIDTLFTNFYFDINKFEKFTPYISMGIGVSRNKTGDFNIISIVKNGDSKETVFSKKKSKNKIAFNVGAGVSYELNKNITLDLINYKYYELGKMSTAKDEEGEAFENRLKMHSITTGIRIKF